MKSERTLRQESEIYVKQIPRGQASERLEKGCLVLEGGAFRGLYTQGFLDAMMLHDLNLSCVIGVSAGALAGVNYVAGQIGRSARTNIGFRHDSRYVGAQALRHSHSILDVGFLTEERGILEPLNHARLNRPEQRLVAVATDCLTGQPTYFEKGVCSDILLAARASGTMPYISPAVMIDGVPYLDGGCSCKIPYRWAMEQGYRKILVLRTRERAYRCQPKRSRLALHVYRRWPAFANALADGDILYNQECDALERLEAEGRLWMINPQESISVSHIEPDLGKLFDLYRRGFSECEALLPTLRAYLAG